MDPICRLFDIMIQRAEELRQEHKDRLSRQAKFYFDQMNLKLEKLKITDSFEWEKNELNETESKYEKLKAELKRSKDDYNQKKEQLDELEQAAGGRVNAAEISQFKSRYSDLLHSLEEKSNLQKSQMETIERLKREKVAMQNQNEQSAALIGTVNSRVLELVDRKEETFQKLEKLRLAQNDIASERDLLQYQDRYVELFSASSQLTDKNKALFLEQNIASAELEHLFAELALLKSTTDQYKVASISQRVQIISALSVAVASFQRTSEQYSSSMNLLQARKAERQSERSELGKLNSQIELLKK